MSPTLPSVEREVTLVHFLRVVQSRWPLILFVGLITGTLTGILFYLTPPLFESTCTILISRTRSKEDALGTDRTVIESDNFVLALQSGEIYGRVLEQFKLSEPPYEFDLDEVRQAVAIWPLRRENAIQVRVQLRDRTANTPQLVADIANFYLGEADKIAMNLIQEDVERSTRLFKSEFDQSRERLEEVRAKYQEAKLASRVEEKKKMIESLGIGQSKYMEAYGQARADAMLKAAQLTDLDQRLQTESPILGVSRALEEEPAFMGVYADRAGKGATSVYSATSATEVPNDVYIKLRELRDTASAELAGAKAVLGSITHTLADYTRRIQESELILNSNEEAVSFWQAVLDSAQLSYQEVYKRFDQAVMAIASDRQDLMSWVQAFPPQKPAGFPRVLVVLASAFLAMTILTVLILLIEVFRATLSAL